MPSCRSPPADPCEPPLEGGHLLRELLVEALELAVLRRAGELPLELLALADRGQELLAQPELLDPRQGVRGGALRGPGVAPGAPDLRAERLLEGRLEPREHLVLGGGAVREPRGELPEPG